MKFKTLIAIFLLTMFLVGCTAQEPETTTSGDMGADKVIESDSSKDMPKYSEEEVDLRIVDNKLDPQEITIKVNEESTLVIHNQQPNEMRIDIPMYQSEVSVDIPADGYEVITVNPQYTGFVAIELNGNQLGTIVVE